MGQDQPDLWVFGYGSLMWRPDFPFAEAFPARLYGWHRRFCIASRYYRGTDARPGLVLGLDRQGPAIVGLGVVMGAGLLARPTRLQVLQRRCHRGAALLRLSSRFQGSFIVTPAKRTGKLRGPDDA